MQPVREGATTNMCSVPEDDESKERRKKLTDLASALFAKENKPTSDDLLNLYSKFAHFEDGDCGTVFELGVEPDIGDRADTIRQKWRSSFLGKLGEAKLEMGRISDNGDVSWSKVETIDDFLPDDKEFQLSILPYLLWERRVTKSKPEAKLYRNQAFRLLDFDPGDKGDVLWKLDVPCDGFPFGYHNENGTCILREHHRQVMYTALSWLLQNGTTMGLRAKNRCSPPSAVVAAICGSAGTGMSRSLIFLMWFLLQKKSPFLLEAGDTRNRTFALVRPGENIVRFLQNAKEASDVLMRDRSIMCIVDPCDVHNGESPELSPLLDVRGPICVTSPSADPSHLPRGDTGKTTVMRFWVSPWDLSHLKTVGPYFSGGDPKFTAKEISRRFQVVGGVPRAIFRERTFSHRRQVITSSKLESDDGLLRQALQCDQKLEHMVHNVPQAYLGRFSVFPFTDENKVHNIDDARSVWVDF